MSLTPWERGKCLVWDATVVHRLSNCYTSLAKIEGSTVAEKAEGSKRSKYQDLGQNYSFEPVAFETLGGIGPSSFKFLKCLGGVLADKTEDRREGIFLRQRLAIAIQMGNASCVQEPYRQEF